jgi:hypothetical protein
VQSDKVLDLTKSPFDEDVDLVSKSDYSKTQAIADVARSEGVEVLISRSVRCPHGGTNVNILSLDAFKAKNSIKRQSWTIFTRQDRVIATSEFPRTSYEFLASDFEDPRLD